MGVGYSRVLMEAECGFATLSGQKDQNQVFVLQIIGG